MKSLRIYIWTLFFISIFLIGCDTEPKQGEWYESISTGKQHKIEHVFEASFELEQFTNRFKKELSGKKKIDEVNLNYLISWRDLLAFRAKEKMKLYYLSDYHKIVGEFYITSALTEKELKEDYKLVK